MDVTLLAFVGAFIGATLGGLIPRYVVEPLRNRAQHKRLLPRDVFRREWGRNPVTFFIKYGGFGRGMK